MTHKGTQTIKTPRLTLRRFTTEDAPAMFANWAKDPEVTKFLCWKPHADVEVSRAVLADWVGRYENDEFYQWAIVPEAVGEPIGTISVVGMDNRVGMVEIGYALGKKWWHQGIMSEALTAVIGYLFAEVGVNRIAAKHDPRNPHSGGVMKKSGMQYEGTHRQAGHSNQGIVDDCVYAILREDRREKNGRQN